MTNSAERYLQTGKSFKDSSKTGHLQWPREPHNGTNLITARDSFMLRSFTGLTHIYPLTSLYPFNQAHAQNWHPFNLIFFPAILKKYLFWNGFCRSGIAVKQLNAMLRVSVKMALLSSIHFRLSDLWGIHILHCSL